MRALRAPNSFVSPMLLWERYWRIDFLLSLERQKRDISVSFSFLSYLSGCHLPSEIELPEGMAYKAGDYLAMCAYGSYLWDSF